MLSDQNETNQLENVDNVDSNEMANSNAENNDKTENVEVASVGINTDELPPEELQRLVDNNKELQDENDVSNIDHEAKDTINNSNNNSAHIVSDIKKDLIDELNEKDKIFSILVKSNAELKSKIDISNQKYNEILQKIESRNSMKTEASLSLKIKEMEKEINANNTETEHYKRMIDQLKNKIEFKTNLERAFNLQSILKAETLNNSELKAQLKSLERVNGVQIKYINNYDKENQISEKLDILKSEIKQTKDSIKDYQEKFTKQDRFIRLVHEKILSLEMMIKKMKEVKTEKTKLFTRDQLKTTLEELTRLKEKISENRNTLNAITKQNNDKMHVLLSQNKKIEIDYKENEKLNKMLIFKKNELKRNIKNMNTGNMNYPKKKMNVIQKKKIEPITANIPNNNVQMEPPHEVVVPPANNNTVEVEQPRKLFSKNPNKNIESTEEINNEMEDPNENEDQLENNDMNDSNLNN